jgi:hypothetical protein
VMEKFWGGPRLNLMPLKSVRCGSKDYLGVRYLGRHCKVYVPESGRTGHTLAMWFVENARRVISRKLTLQLGRDIVKAPESLLR